MGQWQSWGQTPVLSDSKACAPSLSLVSPCKVEIVLPKPTAQVFCEDQMRKINAQTSAHELAERLLCYFPWNKACVSPDLSASLIPDGGAQGVNE